MSPKIILFAGAPSPSIPPDACTITTFSNPFTHLLNITNESPDSASSLPTTSTSSNPILAVAWRSLPATRQPLHTGLTQTININTNAHDDFFFTTAHVTPKDGLPHIPTGDHDHDHDDDDDDGDESLLSRFFEESFAAHRSFLADDTQLDDSLTTTNQTTSLSILTAASASASIPAAAAAAADSAPAPPLCDLRDVPPAPHIAAQSPATVSRNLLVAVLAVAPPRSVTTRWGAPFSLVEVLVGDDTRSGFAITFWVPGPSSRQTTNGSGSGSNANHGDANGPVARNGGAAVPAVRETLLPRPQPQHGRQVHVQVDYLRRQDVVLMRNVALHVFRGRVYGQSLPRGLTRLELLWRGAGGGTYTARDLGARAAAAAGGQRAKAGRVKDWVVRFVGAGAGAGLGERRRTTRSQAKSWDRPPDDSSLLPG